MRGFKLTRIHQFRFASGKVTPAYVPLVGRRYRLLTLQCGSLSRCWPLITFWRMAVDVLKQSAQWAIDTIPRAIGVQKIPALLPEKTEINELKLNLPSYCQADTYSCGAIAGWSVLEFFRPESDFKSFYQSCSPSIVTGTSTTRLTKALREHGISVSNRCGLNFDKIRACLRRGKPVIVTVAEGALFDEDAGHWLVIYGCGWKPHRVFLTGKTVPGFSRQTMTWQDFKRVWNPMRQGLVCSIGRTKRIDTRPSKASR